MNGEDALFARQGRESHVPNLLQFGPPQRCQCQILVAVLALQIQGHNHYVITTEAKKQGQYLLLKNLQLFLMSGWHLKEKISMFAIRGRGGSGTCAAVAPVACPRR